MMLFINQELSSYNIYYVNFSVLKIDSYLFLNYFSSSFMIINYSFNINIIINIIIKDNFLKIILFKFKKYFQI